MKHTFEFESTADQLIEHFANLNKDTMTHVVEGAVLNSARQIYLSNTLFSDGERKYHYLKIKELFAEKMIFIISNSTLNFTGQEYVTFPDGQKLYQKDLEENLIEIKKELMALSKTFKLEVKKPK